MDFAERKTWHPAKPGRHVSSPEITQLKKGTTMKKILSLLGLIAFSFGLTACNTMQGMGEDISSGGKKLEGAAERSQQEMRQR